MTTPGFGGARAGPPVLVSTSSATPGHRRCCSSRVPPAPPMALEILQSADPAETPRSRCAWLVPAVAPQSRNAAKPPGLLTWPAPSRSRPGCAAASLTHFAITSMAKENVVNPPAATWLYPHPLLPFSGPQDKTAPRPAAGHGALGGRGWPQRGVVWGGAGPGRAGRGRGRGGARWFRPPSPGKPGLRLGLLFQLLIGRSASTADV